jgi:hypothetical protein
MNQVKVSIQAVDYRPFTPTSRNNECNIFTVISRLVEKGDTQRVISTKGWIGDSYRIDNTVDLVG